MSLIALSAPLIRLAAGDDGYAQDLFEAVDSDEASYRGLVQGRIGEGELALLTPAEWQWYASWRQSLNGELDPLLLSYLGTSATTRFARFEVRALVLRDRATNELAPQYDNPPELPLQYDPASEDETDDATVGLRWLDAQARGFRVIDTYRPADLYQYAAADDDGLGQGQVGYELGAPNRGGGVHLDWLGDESLIQRAPQEFFADMNNARVEEKVELTIDALQCGTAASDFLIRRLTAAPEEQISPSVSILGGVHVSAMMAQLNVFDDDGGDAVREQLAAFAEDRGINPEWYLRGQPLRKSD